MKIATIPKLLPGLTTRLFHKPLAKRGPGPLTGRSVVLLLALMYLFLGPVRAHTDIVSASLAFGLLALMVVSVLYVLIFGLTLQRQLEVSVHPPDSPPASGETVRLVLVSSPLRVWPLALLDVTIEFAHPSAPAASVRLSGFKRSSRHVVLDVTFPHRGIWKITGTRYELKDPTGFARHAWKSPLDTAITISPPQATETTLPILSSSQRPGELVVDNLNKQGDPFDIKPYHPSDGVKRIIWKAFAKRGELLSRHPEASMTPEGYVVIFVLAGPGDDAVCSKVIAYVRTLVELKLDVVVGCEGFNGRSFATDVESTEKLLVDSVWDTYDASLQEVQRDVTALLDHCAQTARSAIIQKLIVFSSGARITHHEAIARQLGTWLNARSISPVFCLTPPSSVRPLRPVSFLSRFSTVFMTPDKSVADGTSAQQYRIFLASCAQKHWEVYV